jgi:hypothetical protein
MIKARLPYSYVRTGCVGGAPIRERLTSTIVATPAKTLQGLYVKARATAWALEGNDLDPTKEASMNDKVAASIVRDLLHLSATEK